MNPKMLETLNAIAYLLFESTQTKPIVYASFALELLTHESFLAQDIDLLMPEKDWNTIIKALKENGYIVHLDDMIRVTTPHCQVEITSKEKWEKNCGFDFSNAIDFSYYSVLYLNDLDKLYRYLIEDPNRDPHKKKNDHLKRMAIYNTLRGIE